MKVNVVGTVSRMSESRCTERCRGERQKRKGNKYNSYKCGSVSCILCCAVNKYNLELEMEPVRGSIFYIC